MPQRVILIHRLSRLSTYRWYMHHFGMAATPRLPPEIEDYQSMRETAEILEWRVWLAFWGRASTDTALIEEQQRRYAEWRRLLQAIIAATAGKQAAPEQVRLPVDLVANHP